MDLTSTSYQLSRDGQQYGPYPGEQLMEMAQNKQVLPTDHLWCEGMAEWTPAQSFSQLAPIFAAAAPAQQVAVSAAGSPRGAGAAGARPGMAARKSPTSRKAVRGRPGAASGTPVLGKKGANFSILMWALVAFVLGLIMSAAGGAMMGASMASAIEGGEVSEHSLPQPSGMATMMAIGGVILYAAGGLTYSILTLIYLYRAWTVLQVLPGVRSTPGKAIGFLFIPFFNYYWLFVCYHGWAQDYNLLKERSQAPGAPDVPVGLFLAFCIGCFLGFGLILHPIVMSKVCGGINFLASKSDEELAGGAYA